MSDDQERALRTMMSRLFATLRRGPYEPTDARDLVEQIEADIRALLAASELPAKVEGGVKR